MSEKQFSSCWVGWRTNIRDCLFVRL